MSLIASNSQSLNPAILSPDVVFNIIKFLDNNELVEKGLVSKEWLSSARQVLVQYREGKFSHEFFTTAFLSKVKVPINFIEEFIKYRYGEEFYQTLRQQLRDQSNVADYSNPQAIIGQEQLDEFQRIKLLRGRKPLLFLNLEKLIQLLTILEDKKHSKQQVVFEYTISTLKELEYFLQSEALDLPANSSFKYGLEIRKIKWPVIHQIITLANSQQDQAIIKVDPRDGSDFKITKLKAQRFKKSLISLDLSNLIDKKPHLREVAELLKKNNVIQNINLANNDINSYDLEIIGYALKENNSITSINLENNYMSYTFLKYLANILKQKGYAINIKFSNKEEDINLFNLLFNPEKFTERNLSLSLRKFPGGLFKPFIEAFKENNTITNLNLPNTQMLLEELINLAQVVKQKPYEVKVNLQTDQKDLFELIVNPKEFKRRYIKLANSMVENRLTELLELQMLIEFFKENNTITIIDLSNAKIYLEGIISFAEVIRHKPYKVTVMFSKENLRELFELLFDPDKFRKTSVNFSNMNMDDDIVKAIAEVLKINKTIKTINLTSNFITPEGFEYLSEALKVNTTIENIDLSNNFAYEDISNRNPNKRISIGNYTALIAERSSNNLLFTDFAKNK